MTETFTCYEVTETIDLPGEPKSTTIKLLFSEGGEIYMTARWRGEEVACPPEDWSCHQWSALGFLGSLWADLDPDLPDGDAKHTSNAYNIGRAIGWLQAQSRSLQLAQSDAIEEAHRTKKSARPPITPFLATVCRIALLSAAIVGAGQLLGVFFKTIF